MKANNQWKIGKKNLMQLGPKAMKWWLMITNKS
jgi:hypothetical protein